MDFGHVFVEVRNRSTGANAYFDYWGGAQSEGVKNLELTDARRGEHFQFSIPIDADQEASAVQAIRSRLSSSDAYKLGWSSASTCVSGVAQILESAGFDVGSVHTPKGLWRGLMDLANEQPELFEGSQLTGPESIPEGTSGDNFSDETLGQVHVAGNVSGYFGPAPYEDQGDFTPFDGQAVPASFDPSRPEGDTPTMLAAGDGASMAPNSSTSAPADGQGGVLSFDPGNVPGTAGEDFQSLTRDGTVTSTPDDGLSAGSPFDASQAVAWTPSTATNSILPPAEPTPIGSPADASTPDDGGGLTSTLEPDQSLPVSEGSLSSGFSGLDSEAGGLPAQPLGSEGEGVSSFQPDFPDPPVSASPLGAPATFEPSDSMSETTSSFSPPQPEFGEDSSSISSPPMSSMSEEGSLASFEPASESDGAGMASFQPSESIADAPESA
jgi:hypothetical protein